MTVQEYSASLLPQPFEDAGHVHLVGFVVAGEGIHDDVDANAIGELALVFAAGDHSIEALAIGVGGPGASKVDRKSVV